MAQLVAFEAWVVPVGLRCRSFLRALDPFHGELVVLFSGADRCHLESLLQAQVFEQIGYVSMTGRQLFGVLARHRFGGVMINPGSTHELVVGAATLARWAS